MMADRIALQRREGGVGAALLEVAAAPQIQMTMRCVDIIWGIEKRPHNLKLQIQKMPGHQSALSDAQVCSFSCQLNKINIKYTRHQNNNKHITSGTVNGQYSFY